MSDKLQAARKAATARYLAIAEKIKAEAGVIVHHIGRGPTGVSHRGLAGAAYPDGSIVAPRGRTRRQLYTVAHESAHIVLRHWFRRHPRSHVNEYQVEQWAHAALERHGVPVHLYDTLEAKSNVWAWVQDDKRMGVLIDPAVLQFTEFKFPPEVKGNLKGFKAEVERLRHVLATGRPQVETTAYAIAARPRC